MIYCHRNALPKQAVLACIFLSVFSLSFPAAAEMTRLHASVPPRALAAEDRGPIDDEQLIDGVSIQLQPSKEQNAALQNLLTEQQRPGSPLYHQWLTPEQYADQFGADPATVSRVSTWLQSQGLNVIGVNRARTSLRISGSAAQFNSVFRTSIHRYMENGISHFSNAQDLWVPDALATDISGVRNLSDFRPRPLLRPKATPQFTSSGSGSHYLTPADVATIYNITPLYNAQITGAGQTLAIVGQSAINTTDIDAFRSAAGLDGRHLTTTLVPNSGTSVIVAGDTDESTLDIEWAGGIANKTNVIFYYTGNKQNMSVFDSLETAVDDNQAAIISISYGLCEAEASSSDLSGLTTIANRANAQGQTLVAASGDSGAAGCDNGDKVSAATSGLSVNLPASMPQVTAIGGTTFSGDSGASKASTAYWNYSASADIVGSALSYIPETGWNDSPPPAVTPGQGLLATGGGASSNFSKPTWQTGSNVPADGKRDVPDISFSASPNHDGYIICTSNANSPCANGFRNSSNGLNIAGGTSFGTPVFAGALALLEQNAGTTRWGNINSALYTLASNSSNYASVFHDITTGNNIVPCVTGTTDCTTGSLGYSAGTGYDQVTGLGSLNIYALTQVAGSLFSSSSSVSTGGSTSTTSSGGGGGALPPLTLLALSGFAFLRRRLTSRRASSV